MRVFILVALARVNMSHWFNIMTRLAIGSPETRVFILVALARVNMSHWFNIMTRLASFYRK